MSKPFDVDDDSNKGIWALVAEQEKTNELLTAIAGRAQDPIVIRQSHFASDAVMRVRPEEVSQVYEYPEGDGTAVTFWLRGGQSHHPVGVQPEEVRARLRAAVEANRNGHTP